MRDLIKEYLQTIKDIQELGCTQTPYALEEQRQKLHSHILNRISTYLCTDGYNSYTDAYIRSKTIFNNLDIICNIYSECEEWKLLDEGDVSAMTNYLFRYITSSECLMYLEGKVDFPVHIRRLNERSK